MRHDSLVHLVLGARPLRAACNRERNFLWLLTALAGICARPDLLGVTSIVRALGLTERCYLRLLEFFHTQGIDLELLTRRWMQIALESFSPHRLGGQLVLLADGLKVPKSGRKMPAVKRLHQVSDSNTKPEYIRGHSLQAVSLLVSAASSFLAVPLVARIHEGVKFTNRDQRTLPEKLTTLIDSLALSEPFVLIADAYYACASVASWALERGAVLISRVRRNAVGYEPALPRQGRASVAGHAATDRRCGCGSCSTPRMNPGRKRTVRSMASAMSRSAFSAAI